MIVETKKWFLATNKIDVFHYGEAEAGTTISTGQPFLELFDSEEEWLEKLKNDFNITPETE
jgi:hypothetical protein